METKTGECRYIELNEFGKQEFKKAYVELTGYQPDESRYGTYSSHFPDGWHFSDTMPTEPFTIDISRYITKSRKDEPFVVTPEMCGWFDLQGNPINEDSQA